jgi:hypothetical protein
MPDALFVLPTHRSGPLGRAARVLAIVWSWRSRSSWRPARRVRPGRSPRPVPPPRRSGPARMVAAGEGTSFLLKADGTVWSWGDQRDGRLGDGQDRDNSRTRTQPGPSSVLSGDPPDLRSAPRTGLALRADGNVLAWGANGDGRLETAGRRAPSPRRARTGADRRGGRGRRRLRPRWRSARTRVVLAWGQNVRRAAGAGRRCIAPPVPTHRCRRSQTCPRESAAGGGQAFAIRRDGCRLRLGQQPGRSAGARHPGGRRLRQEPAHRRRASTGANITVAIPRGTFTPLALLADGSLRTFGASNAPVKGRHPHRPVGRLRRVSPRPFRTRRSGLRSTGRGRGSVPHATRSRRDGSRPQLGQSPARDGSGDGTSGAPSPRACPATSAWTASSRSLAGERTLAGHRAGRHPWAASAATSLGQCAQSQGLRRGHPADGRSGVNRASVAAGPAPHIRSALRSSRDRARPGGAREVSVPVYAEQEKIAGLCPTASGTRSSPRTWTSARTSAGAATS